MDNELVVKNIRQALKDYIVKCDLKSLVIGVSGGIDSTLCCALARPVCDELGIKLIGRSLPTSTNKPDEIKRADLVGKAFCHDYKEVKLNLWATVACDVMGDFIYDAQDEAAQKKRNIRKGNIKARMRMIYLYDLAQERNGLVLSTDNLTEYYLGFWTLHGDVGDLGMLQNLWKTEVYELADWISNCFKSLSADDILQQRALDKCIVATPTDGLGITNSDLDQFGVGSYAEVDKILQAKFTVNGKDNPVIQMRKRTEYKRNNPYNFSRELICKNNSI